MNVDRKRQLGGCTGSLDHASDPHAAERLAAGGGTRATSVGDTCSEADAVITMLPAGEQVREVYLGDEGVLALVRDGTLRLDMLETNTRVDRRIKARRVARLRLGPSRILLSPTVRRQRF